MNDFEMFDAYRKENTYPNDSTSYCDVDYLLRFWRENKSQYLFDMFGDKLILEREVTYKKNDDELSSDMNRMLHDNWDFVNRVIDALRKVMGINDWRDEDETKGIVWRNLRGCLMNTNSLLENTLSLGYDDYTSDGPSWIKSYTIKFEDGSKVKLQKDMKITRAFTQICKHLGMEQEWEQFRIAHSQVLNTKQLTGTLCLSIHPLDYATASDNSNGWSSCMSWRENACYRMGTIEMMNSPIVICAYLKSKKQTMEIDEKEWNSKKWRAWIIVNETAIICNRHYPYHNADFATQCIEWVRELAGAAHGWTYDDIHTNFYEYMSEHDWELEYYTYYMYNDLGGDDVIGCVNSKHKSLHNSILFSGPAECMVCGEEIRPEVQGADQLECSDCFRTCYCECGEAVDEDNCYHDPDGNPMCISCYERYCRECALCGETVWKDDVVKIKMPIHHDEDKAWIAKFAAVDHSRFMRRLGDTTDEVCICEHCADKNNVIMINYKKDYEEVTGIDEYGWYSIPHPLKVSANDAFKLICTDDYGYALYVLNIIKERPDYGCYDDEDIAYAKLVIEFWDHQCELMKRDYIHIEEMANKKLA